jgi:hypothetical protein
MSLKQGYIDKTVFRTAVLILIALAVYGLIAGGFDTSKQQYFYCREDSLQRPCKIEFGCLEGDPFCVPEKTVILQPGESYGPPPPFIERNFWLIAIFVLAIAFAVNHALWTSKNKGGVV